MKARLSRAPDEFTDAGRSNPLVLSLPSPTGASRVSPSRSRRSWRRRSPPGIPSSGPTAGRASTTRRPRSASTSGRTGFHAQVLSPNGDWYIDPYYHLDQQRLRQLLRARPRQHARPVRRARRRRSLHRARPRRRPRIAQRVVGTELRTYRLALAADGEYSQFHGGTVPLVHNEIVVAVNRVTGVYERELGDPPPARREQRQPDLPERRHRSVQQLEPEPAAQPEPDQRSTA